MVDLTMYSYMRLRELPGNRCRSMSRQSRYPMTRVFIQQYFLLSLQFGGYLRIYQSPSCLPRRAIPPPVCSAPPKHLLPARLSVPTARPSHPPIDSSSPPCPSRPSVPPASPSNPPIDVGSGPPTHLSAGPWGGLGYLYFNQWRTYLELSATG